MKADGLIAELEKYSSDHDAVQAQRFFKTGPGEYGEGDVFIGVRMPDIRKVGRQFKDLDTGELEKLIKSPIHEHRMVALIIATERFKKASSADRQIIYNFYIKALKNGYINNWDLVDVTCDKVIGEFLKDIEKDFLYELASSKNLWERRVAIISTFAYIKNGDSTESIKVAKMLLHDEHDLIHKAVGWMLREVGKRVDESILLEFLDSHAHEMPRTMLRYAIEKLPESKRQFYLKVAK